MGGRIIDISNGPGGCSCCDCCLQEELCGETPIIDCELPFYMQVSGVANKVACSEADCTDLNNDWLCLQYRCSDQGGGCEPPTNDVYCYGATQGCCWASDTLGGGGTVDICNTYIGDVAFGFGIHHNTTDGDGHWDFTAWLGPNATCSALIIFNRRMDGLGDCSSLLDFIESIVLTYADICWIEEVDPSDSPIDDQCDITGIVVRFQYAG